MSCNSCKKKQKPQRCMKTQSLILEHQQKQSLTTQMLPQGPVGRILIKNIASSQAILFLTCNNKILQREKEAILSMH